MVLSTALHIHLSLIKMANGLTSRSSRLCLAENERKVSLVDSFKRGFVPNPRRLLTHQPRCSPLGEEIVSFGLWMHKQGYRNSTVRHCTKGPESTAKRAHLPYPEYVKTKPLGQSLTLSPGSWGHASMLADMQIVENPRNLLYLHKSLIIAGNEAGRSDG